ncbi:hypothetical protein QU617_09500 [Pseudomonas guariconensis]|uniref:hypothetical protein n=1 Tax=Pseudomonas guariconensis TaxID=1288410 RepID=UPI0025A97AE8|nr:hypothetical protein [Pseudomonas guariconensis]MDM9593555.1 hypothetical protein [Pseudomonas guariconensis]MDM9606382.1 hypothetical protein [Pseudomonas guariconensis]MDM9611339.1 hypothetical protein [Pseudomonas guariconensis]
MDTAQWITLFEQAFRAMDKKLEQVLQLNSCREHWIQAEISLHAWFKNEVCGFHGHLATHSMSI